MLELQFYNFFCLRTAVSLYNFKLHLLTFVQRFEAVALDCAEVYEYIFSAFNFDETEAFLSVEPFNCSVLHVNYTSKSKINMFLCSLHKQIKIHTL